MSMPRRQKVLLVVFLVLASVAVGYFSFAKRQTRKRAAHWEAMDARVREYQKFNQSTADANGPDIRQQAAAAPAAKIVPGSNALIEPVHLLWKDSDWEGKLLDDVDGCLRVADDTDLIWCGNDVFLMNEPGRLEHLWSDPPGSGLPLENIAFMTPGRRLCYDGRYIWLESGRDPFQRLMVIDPRERQAWEFGSSATGLFSAGGGRNAVQTSGAAPGWFPSSEPTGVSLAPIGPGVVCAFFVGRDAWLALLHFSPDGRREVETVDVPRPMTLDKHREQMFSLETTVSGQPLRRIIVGREFIAPLVLDPQSRQISAAPANTSLVGFRTAHWCLHDGAVWWQQKLADGDRHTLLLRATLPDLKQQVVLSNVPPALLASHERGLVLVGEDCWLLNDKSLVLERLNADCFWTFSDRLVPPPTASPGAAPEGPPQRPLVVKQETQEPAPNLDELFETPPGSRTAAGRRLIHPTSLYSSSNYGLLLEVSPASRDWSELYQVTIDGAATDSRTPAQPAAGPTQRAATSSRLTLVRQGGDPVTSTRPLAMLAGAVEPDRIHRRDRLPVLARELVRQSLLLAASSELGCVPADETIGESPRGEWTAGAEFQLSTWFRDDGTAEVSLQTVEDDTDETVSLWQQPLKLRNPGGTFDYRLLAETAERWSREEFPRLLRESLPDIGQAANDVVPREVTSAAIERDLNQMSFLPQFVAVRACACAAGDEPDDRLGGLVRGYANLGVLTAHHWAMAHKVFQARALLYAQRWVVGKPASPSALWHRAYAAALAGLPRDALEDIAKADQLASGDPAADGHLRPVWVDVIAAACRCDDNALAAYNQNDQVAQLAGLLRLLHLSRLQSSVLATQAATNLLERQPECFRAYDVMCDCCLFEEVRPSTATALTVFQQRFPERLRELPELPASVSEQIDSASDKGDLAERLATALREAPLSDPCGLSWQALGALARETLFIQCWRRAHFLHFQVAEPADEFLASSASLVAHHPYRRLFDFYADAEQSGPPEKLDERQQSAAAELIERLDLASVNEAQQRIYDHFFGRAWQVRRPEQYVAAVARPARHRDDVVGDLLDQLDDEKRARLLPLTFGGLDRVANINGSGEALHETAQRLQTISPGSPDALAAAVRSNMTLASKLLGSLLDRYRDSPQVLRALVAPAAHGQRWQPMVVEARPQAEIVPSQEARDQQVLRAYIKLSPDAWAYLALARSYFADGKLDSWQALLDEYLAHSADGAQASSLRLEIANTFLARGEWEKALPYAEASAATNSEAGMICLIRCYQGLGDDEQEGAWHERITDRFPSAATARDHYLWSRRTGLGDARALADRALTRIGPGQLFAAPAEQMRFAAFYWLAHRPDEAIRCYELAASMAPEQGNPAFCHLCIALISEEKGDRASRDEALAQATAMRRPESQHFQKLSDWLSEGFAAQKLDVDAAGQFVAEAPRNDRPAMNYLVGYAMLLTRQSQDAVQFLQMAATLGQGAGAPSRTLASAALRDRGLIPGRLNEPLK
ncbi:MAG TPA: hypothetical protein VJ783_24470 [Pirellulales bacterium]|nr:hypothetical protein [Pirellulales bacterium]